MATSFPGREIGAQTQLRFRLNPTNNSQSPHPQILRPSQHFPNSKIQLEVLPPTPPASNFSANQFPGKRFPVTLTHVSSGHSINVERSDLQPPSPNERTDLFSSSGDSRGFIGSYSREDHFFPPQEYQHDLSERNSIPESGDSGLSRTPEDMISEGHPLSMHMMDPSFRQRHSTAPQTSMEMLYQQRHVPVQRQRSTNLQPPSKIDFSINLHIRSPQFSFGFSLADGAIVEKVEGPPAIEEDLQPGDRVTSINGRASDTMSRSELKELLLEAARYRSVTLCVRRATRPTPPELYRTYTLDLPLGSVRVPQPGVPFYPGYSPPYPLPAARYLSCHHLPPCHDDSAQGRHSWPHGPSLPTGPQPMAYPPREDQPVPHQLVYSSGMPYLQPQQLESADEFRDQLLPPIAEVPRRGSNGESVQFVLETMRQLRDKYGPELEARELEVLDSFLQDPDIVPTYRICKRMQRAKESLRYSDDPKPKITNSAHLLGDCLKDLRTKQQFSSDGDRGELVSLLSSLSLTHALVSHDRIATTDYYTPFPSPLFPSGFLTPLAPGGGMSPTISRSMSTSGLLEGTGSREFRLDGHLRSGSLTSSVRLGEMHIRQNSGSSLLQHRPNSRLAYGVKGGSARIVLVRKSHKQMGCTVNKVGDCILVSGTLRHSDAERCGQLHPGDEILEINGRSVLSHSSEQVMNFILTQPAPMIVFLIAPCSAAEKKEIFIRSFYDFSLQQVPDCPFPGALLSFRRGDVLRLLSCQDSDWWEAKHLQDAPEAVPGLIPAKKKAELTETHSDPQEASRGSGKKKLRWPKNKRKKKPELVLDPSSLPLTQDMVTYEEVGLLTPSNPAKPRPILIVGAAGVGHKRVIQSVLDKYPYIFSLPIYHTSRPPKSYEKKGIEFHFTSRRIFDQCVAQKGILDPWESGSHMYGLAPTSMHVVVETGKFCIQALTPESMRYIRNQTNLLPYVVFLAAPRPDLLREQLKSTQKGAFRRVRSDQGSRDKQITTIISASEEIANEFGGYFDEVITNLGSEVTAEHIYQISVRLSKEPQWVPISWIHTLTPHCH